jgi:membrane protein DedA with SNARE-associated domain/rhodanese-related sulfurtransferase
MEYVANAVAQHGYHLLFAIVFLEAIGFPVPAALGLLIAGGAAARGTLAPATCLAFALLAMLSGDTLMYLLGRYTGWWLLGMLCRISLNPEACILESADSFYKRGRVLLVVAKFLPGINTMAPPLSGSMGMPATQFLGLDFIAAMLYAGAWFGSGYLFSGFLTAIARGYSAFGDVVGVVVAAGVVLWIGYRVRLWRAAKKLRPVRMMNASDLAGELAESAAKVVVLDVRSHGYYEKGTTRIHGSARLEPNAIGDLAPGLPKDKKIVLYCTCAREATSARVARALEDQGLGLTVSVLEGGFRAWKKAGLPVEAVPEHEVVPLPKFA